ncbi:MAG: hypothetical protein AAF489_14725 [Bacteroidota bacterium]
MAEQNISTAWHFPIMILASLLLFFIVIRIVLGKIEFREKKKTILLLSVLVVVIGMLLGKYGAQIGLAWWIYYPVPMLMTVLLPPIVLKMSFKKTILYLFLSFLSAPVIHSLFSFLLGWSEYMPFWHIPYIGDL